MYYGSGAQFGFWLCIIFLWLPSALIFGYMTKKLASRKGYTDYFWTGFFLQIAGLIYVAGLPVDDDKNMSLMADAIHAAMMGSQTTPPDSMSPISAEPSDAPPREAPEATAHTEKQPVWAASPAIDNSNQTVVPVKSETEGFAICPLCGTEQPEANHSCWKCRANFAR
jgi:hypothetical protein